MQTGTKITIVAFTGNAAFTETEDIRETLHKAVDKLCSSHDLLLSIYDLNGNEVGYMKQEFPKRRIRQYQKKG